MSVSVPRTPSPEWRASLSTVFVHNRALTGGAITAMRNAGGEQRGNWAGRESGVGVVDWAGACCAVLPWSVAAGHTPLTTPYEPT